MQNKKQIPNSLNAEQSIVWAMLIDEDIINLVELEYENFYDDKLSTIFRALKILKEHNKKVDIITVKEFLDSKGHIDRVWGFIYLSELTEIVPTSSNWKEYANIVKEKSDRRKIINYAMQIYNKWFDESEEMQDVLSSISNISEYIFSLTPEKKEWDTVSYINAFEDMKEKYLSRGWMLWTPSVYPEIDKYTKWVIDWKVYTIVAYSNVWKSRMSYSYVNNFLKQGKKVMYISLEVDKGMLFKDLLTNYENKTTKEIMDSNYSYDMGNFENLEIYDNVYKLEEIKTLIKSKNPDIVFIDFIQNIICPWTETEKMTRIAQELQLLAISTGVTLFNLSQANNDSRFKDWDKITPKGSWAIFASSDVIFAMNRSDDWEIFYTIAKNKYWPNNKKFLLIPDFEKSCFQLSEEIINNRNTQW